MKFMNEILGRLVGLSVLIAGICYVLVGIFHPANLLSAVTIICWEIVHVFACAMFFFGVLGMVGLYVRQVGKTGWLGLIGYFMLIFWFVVIMGFSFVEVFVLSHVATASSGLVQVWMGMFNGFSGFFDLGAFSTIWILAGFIYILGGLLFGIAIFRVGIFLCWAGALLALSILLVFFAVAFFNAV